MTDGFVRYASAHLDGAASERIVSATHVCEADPEVIAEVRRILHLHLAEPDGPTPWSPPDQVTPGNADARPATLAPSRGTLRLDSGRPTPVE